MEATVSATKVSDATMSRDFDYRWQQVFAPGAGHPPRTRNPGSKQHQLRLRQHRANPTLCPRQCPRAGIETARASRRHSGSRTQLVQQDHSSVLRVSTGVSSTGRGWRRAGRLSTVPSASTKMPCPERVDCDIHLQLPAPASGFGRPNDRGQVPEGGWGGGETGSSRRLHRHRADRSREDHVQHPSAHRGAA